MQSDNIEHTSASEESDGEFEAPNGFQRVEVKSKESISDILSDNKELWLFRVPADFTASCIDGVRFKLPKKNTSSKVLCQLSVDSKNYNIKLSDLAQSSQLVNAFPNHKNGKKLALGKPFSRSFSVIRQLEPPTKTQIKRQKLENTQEKLPKKKKRKKEKTSISISS